MNRYLRNIWVFLFNNFMWLYLVSGVASTIFGKNIPIPKYFMLLSFVFFLANIGKVKLKNILDLFVLLFVLWILLNSLIIDYPNHTKLWIQALVTNIFPLSFYFIAKIVHVDIEEILEKASIPMIIAMVCGLIFYYTEPGWYTAMKFRQIYNVVGDGAVTDEMLIEAFRLSSFWVTPYVIGYASMYFADYNLHKLFKGNFVNNKKEELKYFIFLFLCVVVIFLTQFRATIFGLCITIVYFLFFSKNKIKVHYLIIIGISSTLLLSTLLNEKSETGVYLKERIMKGVDSEHLESRLEFTSGGVDLMTLSGNGFGRYGVNAKIVNKEWSMVDSEYQKVLAELGVVGFITFVGLIIIGLCKSFRKKTLQLEFMIVMFFAFAFIGSSCISVSTTFPFIFWYVLGRISVRFNYKPINKIG